MDIKGTIIDVILVLWLAGWVYFPIEVFFRLLKWVIGFKKSDFSENPAIQEYQQYCINRGNEGVETAKEFAGLIVLSVILYVIAKIFA
ncbi:hypothetical protein [uncultured Ruminococcus sp.]|mgnify:CR=1 FL=1|uniref:hypothetical protein n=1 Tax=uncultured Ruminococcus sp. TaxID=165186 RepID=UPI00263920A7|nr:hypothetical protein [uncultured Ruminococcus sp.]